MDESSDVQQVVMNDTYSRDDDLVLEIATAL